MYSEFSNVNTTPTHPVDFDLFWDVNFVNGDDYSNGVQLGEIIQPNLDYLNVHSALIKLKSSQSRNPAQSPSSNVIDYAFRPKLSSTRLDFTVPSVTHRSQSINVPNNPNLVYSSHSNRTVQSSSQPLLQPKRSVDDDDNRKYFF